MNTKEYPIVSNEFEYKLALRITRNRSVTQSLIPGIRTLNVLAEENPPFRRSSL